MKAFVVCLFALALVAISAPMSSSADSATVGGSTQVKAQEGCMNQWMFNGMWRVRITNVAFRSADPFNAWLVTMQWANGTTINGLTPVDTNVQNMVLVLANGDTISTNLSTATTLKEQKLDYHSFPASGQFTHTQDFGSYDVLDQNNKPAKLLITFDVAAYKKANPTGGRLWNQKTPAYNYRIKLDCSK